MTFPEDDQKCFGRPVLKGPIWKDDVALHDGGQFRPEPNLKILSKKQEPKSKDITLM